ncbi:hypothetical protein H6F93_06775 [Leptolyngbya sp. FACHB-671]|uniref:hypothetical protein n=1 Tax=Leptolyngbya sp. FACHB-671 TaxID=2692812 RepID=UPI0016828168|nr:hypothetical protein [Leptolyngbya sp. FACHB-671]MBD2067231.1 hypothetical protein [Leptolyngbya sp. FACHB-671]
MVRFQKSIGGVARVALRNEPYKIGDRTMATAILGAQCERQQSDLLTFDGVTVGE